MRDLLLLIFIGLCLAAALRHPFAGLLTWAWFTLMTPHQLAYGVYGLPLNTIIAGVTIAAYAMSGQMSRFRMDPITALIIALAGWLTMSQLFSLDPANSALYYSRFIKTLLFILLCIQMASDKLRLNALVWMLVLGIGFFAAKGAIFTFVTFGAYHVQGLPNTVIEDNNHFGIAVATILPLIMYLRSEAARPWMRTALLGLFCLCVIAIIGTQSRGAFLCLVAFSGFFWLRSKRKASILAGLVFLVTPVIIFMPAKWTDRMSTISDAANDESFMGRVDAWVINYKLAIANPITGAGLRNSYEKDIAAEVDPARAETAKAAHSIYFEILGGSGFVGLAIYLSLFATAAMTALRLKRREGDPEIAPWKPHLARYALTSLTVFAIGGASTSMEMWDGYLMIIALIAALNRATETSGGRQKGYALGALRSKNWRRKKSLAADAAGTLTPVTGEH